MNINLLDTFFLNMSIRITNLELSKSIEDYIKELFDGIIKQVLENNTKTKMKYKMKPLIN